MSNKNKKPDALAGYVEPSVAVLVASTLTINLLSLALPLMTLQIYDRVLPNQSWDTLSVLAIGVAIALTLEAVLKVGRAYLMGWTGAAFEHRLSCDVTKHILHADLMALEKAGTGAYLQHIAAIPRLKFCYNGEILTAVLEGVFVLVFLGLIAYIGGWIVLVPIMLLSAFAGLCLIYGQAFNQQLKERTERDNQRYNFLVQTLGGIHTLKAFGLEQPFQRRYERMETQSSAANLVAAQSSASLFNASTVMANIMVACILTCGALLVLHGTLSTGALVACILLSGRMMQPLQRLLQLWVRYHDFRLVHDQITSLLAVPAVRKVRTALPEHSAAGLVLDDVFFRYSTEGEWLLKGISLELEKGQSVALHGRDGSGKSTLLKLVAGVYAPEKGHIFVNGLPPHEASSRNLARSVGLLSSEGVIFRGTIRNNLTCFGEIDEASALAMAERLGVKADVARLPAGYDTHLEGTTSDSIAPGLKQRIVLARVLASKPEVILFDNADQALDQQGYRLLLELLAELKPQVAMLIVSDDIQVTRLADRQLMMYRGRIIARQQGQQQEAQEAQL
ncbi:MAG: ATP-binding cassette domain-containing protein [Proteobacteria bacterium]|nr:ATP-binding cassette domain-containing protein [Pseudomonadota bacterium]